MSTSSGLMAAAHETAREVFGHERLQPGQELAIGAVLQDRDVLLVSATGYGKSLVYQLPTVVRDRLTIVVSPLLALQQDQLDQLPDALRDRAARLSSAESAARNEETLERAERGDLLFLALAPEQLADDDVRRRLRAARPALAVVDEAHCVSTWGHHFRPDYLRLGQLLADLGRPQLLALTATAAGPVREDIVARLAMEEPEVVVTGFARETIALSVRPCTDEADQVERVVEQVLATSGTGLVYTRTRKAAEAYGERLRTEGLRAATYHAGLRASLRREVHQQFMDGELDVICATSAFGMGIDKQDVRYVLHAQVPESVDTYYQEFGRAGRDQADADAVLFYRPEDLALGRFFSPPLPRRREVEAVVAAVEGSAREAGGLAARDRKEVQRRTGLGARKVGRILNLLDDVLAAQEAPSPGGVDVVAGVLELAEAHRRLERSRVEMMRAYAETGRCRSDFVLGYFGEQSAGPCARCDRCRSGEAQLSAGPERYPVGGAVEHPTFGAGCVVDTTEREVTVLFEEHGYRTLDAGIVEEQELLRVV